jgi:hypothetical protein
MKLEELSADQAYVLAKEYLGRLAKEGKTILSPMQQDVHNGLYFYGVVQNALLKARYGDDREKERAVATINQCMPTVRRCRFIVDRWFELDQPLGDFELPVVKFMGHG